MRKELVCYVSTSEEGEECSVQRVAADTTFVQLRLGGVVLVLNKVELMDAIGSVEFYGSMFDEEKLRAEQKSKAAAVFKPTVQTPQVKEEETELVFDLPVREGPTDSELKLLETMNNLFPKE